MVIPQVRDQVRRAPTLALRAVFAGIGRILMAADRTQAATAPAAAQPGGHDEHRQQAAGQRPQPPDATTAVPGSRWRSLDQTGNVRLLPAEDAGDDAAPAASEPALPLARYDELSLASIRARLRGLDAGQLRVLADHERRNAERPDVLGMLERRIEKLEASE
jgi:hypothetical protein